MHKRDLTFSPDTLDCFSSSEIQKLEPFFSEPANIIRSAPNKYFAEKISLKGAYYGVIELSHDNLSFRCLEVS